MAYPVPKIIYDPGTGPVTLSFSYPPIQKPGAEERTAIRHDSDTISGIRQSITERVDLYWTLQMDFIPAADVAAWAAFIDYAVAGGSFDYYPDATLTPFLVYTLDDTDWVLAFVCFGVFKCKMKFRRVLVSS